MEYPLYFLQTEPFEGFVPQDFFQWLNRDVTDEQLAEAFAVVNNHCGTLMHLVADDDSWGEQALEDWHDVEDRFVSIIIDRLRKTDALLPEKHGTHYLVAPFMHNQGYRNCNGTWIRN